MIKPAIECTGIYRIIKLDNRCVNDIEDEENLGDKFMVKLKPTDFKSDFKISGYGFAINNGSDEVVLFLVKDKDVNVKYYDNQFDEPVNTSTCINNLITLINGCYYELEGTPIINLINKSKEDLIEIINQCTEKLKEM